MKEVLTLPRIGTDPQYICVRETAPQNSVVIIDMNMPMQRLRRPITADSALMNPNSRILALKGKSLLCLNEEMVSVHIALKCCILEVDWPQNAWPGDTDLCLKVRWFPVALSSIT
ncbi:hypothetical protein V6N13_075149 [Hibiscus sabdariffa]